MEKYGVVTREDKAKTAGSKKHCPECGQELEKNANVHKCPQHGTKPFEGEPDGDKKES